MKFMKTGTQALSSYSHASFFISTKRQIFTFLLPWSWWRYLWQAVNQNCTLILIININSPSPTLLKQKYLSPLVFHLPSLLTYTLKYHGKMGCSGPGASVYAPILWCETKGGWKTLLLQLWKHKPSNLYIISELF